MDNKSLLKLGLTENESITYLVGLELGSASVLQIARKSGINRSMLYDILDSLIARGLVLKTVRGKKTRYVFKSPEKLQELFTKKMEWLEKVVPELKELAERGEVKPTITFHEGINGIKSTYLDTIDSKEKKLFAFVGVESLLSRTKELEKFWDEEFKYARQKKEVFGYLLIPDNRAGKKFQEKDNKNFRESRLVDTTRYNFPAEILMYDDTTIFISYTKHEELAISIQSPAVTETIKMIWNFMWEGNKPREE